MPTYNISRARANAKKIGVTVKPSTRQGKKLDVYKDGKKVASIGDLKYYDFTVHGDEQRRRNYLSRHAKLELRWEAPAIMLGRYSGLKLILLPIPSSFYF